MRAALLFLGLALIGAASASAQQKKGVQVYVMQGCPDCHSIHGVGNTKGALDEVGSKLTVQEIQMWIIHPTAMAARHDSSRKPAMTGKYDGLPRDDLRALTRYLASQKVTERQPSEAAPPGSQQAR